MSLDRLRRTWETLGRDDPLWAVLSEPSRHNNQWDPEEFFRTGREEIGSLIESLRRRDIEIGGGRCLDFGCGVGRVTQALSAYFDTVDGVDIAESMIDWANRYNRVGDRCRFHVNASDDLALFPDASFDFVYSNIVLQHMEPDLSERYIAEFLRVLTPGGLAVFQVPSRFREIARSGLASHHAELAVEAEPSFDVLRRAAVAVRVRNPGPEVWAASSPVQVGNHWLDRHGRLLVQDDGRSPLPGDMGPGDERTVGVWVTAPSQPGRYILEFDLVEEGVTWFAERGSTTARADVTVGLPSLRTRMLRALQRTGRRDGTPDDDSRAVMEMHAVPKERVVAISGSGGGEVLDIESFDVSGSEWESYRYYIRKVG